MVHCKFNDVQWSLYTGHWTLYGVLHRLQIGGCVGVSGLEDQILWGAGSKRNLSTGFNKGGKSYQQLKENKWCG